MQKGFPHFNIESLKWTRNNQQYDVEITIRQKLRFAENYYSNVPVELFFMGDDWQFADTAVLISGSKQKYTFQLDFAPLLCIIDKDNKISDARVFLLSQYDSVGDYDFNEARMLVEVEQISDSVFLCVEHHWIGPDNYINNTKGIMFSDYRYWSVNGIMSEDFKAKATIAYNGRTSGAFDGTNYLDHSLDYRP